MSNKTKDNKVADTIGAVVILGLGLLCLAFPPLTVLFAAIMIVGIAVDPYGDGNRNADTLATDRKYKK